MLEPHHEKIVSFASTEELGEWLQSHSESERELWVKIYKKKSKKSNIGWNEVVIEALCWGWIDGIKKSFDDESYLQRITPRKLHSVWSRRNREHVIRLIAEGRMQEPGLIHVRAAQADGRWDKAYATSEMEVPLDFQLAVDSYPGAKKTFEALNKSEKLAITLGLTMAKRSETRKRRFDQFLEILRERDLESD